MDANKIEQHAANTMLDRGVRYQVGEETVTLRPLRFGTLLLICEQVAASGLTFEKLETGEVNHFQLFSDYSELMLTCVAIAELNDKDLLTDEQIAKRVQFYKESLHAMQVYELFAQVIHLSGIQSFTTTIRLLMTLKTANLSPKVKGS